MNIQNLIEDDLNANKGTKRGKELLSKSISDYGLGRGILIDKNNRVIAGNKTKKVAEELGVSEVEVVETNGNILVAVMREDLDIHTPQGRGMAIMDNRVQETSIVWDVEHILEIQETFKVDLSKIWNESQLEEMIKNFEDAKNITNLNETTSTSTDPVNIIKQIVFYFEEDAHFQVLNDLEEIGKEFGFIDDNTLTIDLLLKLFNDKKQS